MKNTTTKKQMSVKRYDNKKRRLQPNEYQRANGSYEFRYKDLLNKQCSVYKPTLAELREVELKIEKELSAGVDYKAGQMTVEDMVKQYANTKRVVWSINSHRTYKTVLNRLSKESFGKIPLNQVTLSMAQEFVLALHHDGLKGNTIQGYINLLHPAFENAIDEKIIMHNPFRFSLYKILPKDAKENIALTQEQVFLLLEVLDAEKFSTYRNEVFILLETGLRVSELYGLTLRDIDFEKNCIHVTKQLYRTEKFSRVIGDTKTREGCRTIYMSQPARRLFKTVIDNRPQLEHEPMVGKYSGFLFLDKNNNPKVAMHLQNHLRRVRKDKLPEDFPAVTPHVLRHTYCSNMVRAHMDIKCLQVMLGHTDAKTTLNVYSHLDAKTAEKAANEAADYLNHERSLMVNAPNFPAEMRGLAYFNQSAAPAYC